MSVKLHSFALIAVFCIWYGNTQNVLLRNQCYVCRGINCLRTTLLEVPETCIYDLDVCVTIFNKFTVEAKGCLLNVPVELRSKCHNTTNPECQMCVGGLCNKYGRRDFKCYECNEKDDLNCSRITPAIQPVQCRIPTAPNSYCYTERTPDGIKRGCALHVKEQNECLKNNNCVLCNVEDGPGCNDGILEGGGMRKSAPVVLLFMCALMPQMLFRS